MKHKFYTSRYDIPFKEIFMNDQNEDILRCLLENILHIKIGKIRYLNLERNTTNKNFHKKYFDLLVETEDKKIQVEVNSSAANTDYIRNMAYICDTYAHVTLRGEDYSNEYEIIQINLTYGLKKGKLMQRYQIQDEKGEKFVENFKIYEINMDKYMEFWYNGDEKEIEKNKYIIMLDLGEKDLKELSKKDKVVTKYMEELEKINEDPEFHHYMTHEEDMRKRENTRMKQGIEQARISIAKAMLEENEDINRIAKFTGLSIHDIEEIIKKGC